MRHLLTFTVLMLLALPASATTYYVSYTHGSDAMTFKPGSCVGGGSDYMIAITNGTSWSCH